MGELHPAYLMMDQTSSFLFHFFSMSFLVCGSLLKMHLEVPAYALLALILAGTRVALTYLFLGCEW